MANLPSEQSAVTLSVQIPPQVRDKLKELADVTGRSKSFLATAAIESYLSAQVWQVKALEQSIKKANSEKAKFYSHQQVADWLNSWGTSEEKEPPK